MKKRFIVLHSILVVLCWPLAAANSGPSNEPSECMNVPTCLENPKGYFLAWRILPGTIKPGGTETVALKGRLPPFSWAVRGDGFELGSSDGAVNTLEAGEDACGSAEITVIDRIGNSITGYVRCTDGSWGDPTEGCILHSEPDLVPSEGAEFQREGKERTIQKILGKYRQTQTRWGPTGRYWGRCPHEACDEFCATAKYCNPEYGCDRCLLSAEDLPCRNAGYHKTGCPPSCRRWCFCTVEYYHQEWICSPEKSVSQR